MRLYYKIWMDCIVSLRSIDANKDNWQIKSMVAMSLAMTFNLLLFMSILQKHILKFYFYELNFSYFSKLLNGILTIVILFVLPCCLINYLLIFLNKRYEKLLNKYSSHKGKLFITYFLISIIFPQLLMWLSIILKN